MIWPFKKAQSDRDAKRGSLEHQNVDRLVREAVQSGATRFDLNGVPTYNMAELPASMAHLSEVTELVLVNTGTRSVKPLSGLSKLETLDLSYSGNLSDISPLEGLRNLKKLSLFRSGVTNLSPLRHLQNLTSLGIERAGATDFTPLSALTKLEHLNLTDTEISDLSVLQGLRNLKSLGLWNTQVKDLSPLAHLTQLESLDLWNTRVRDVTPLAKLPQLRHLNLSHTDVTDLGPLGNRSDLTFLALWNTPLQAQSKGIGHYYGRWYDSDIIRCISAGDLEGVKASVARGAMVSEDQWEGPIHAAIHSGQVDICRFLLSLDSHIANDVAFYDGVYPADTALSLAIDCNQPEIVQLLLQHNVRIALSYDDADYWDVDMEELSGLHMSAAARANDVGLLQHFMKAGCAHDARDGRGLTALHWAVVRESRDAAHFLLNHWRADQGQPPVSLQEMTDAMLSQALDQIGDPKGEFGYAREWRPGGC